MIYLVFHEPHLKDSLNYVVKNNIIRNLEENGLSFTLNPDEERDVILFTSAYDYCYELKKIKSTNRIHILALSDPDDIIFSKDGVSLSTDAINAYKKADKLLVFTQEHKDFLIKNGFMQEKILLLNLSSTYKKEELINSEKNSFRSFYQIPKEVKLILFLGNDLTKKDISRIEELSLLSPEKRFLCFGPLDTSSIKEKRREMLASSTNILFFDNIPEELYRSAIQSVDCLILYTKSQTFPIVLNDFATFGTKIISYRQHFNLSFLKDINSEFPLDFPSLYQIISSL